MSQTQSHVTRQNAPVRPRVGLKLLMVASLLGALATALGVMRMGTVEKQFSVIQNTREVQSQVSLLSESVRSSLERVRAEAIGYYQMRLKQETLPLLPEGPILHWAELKVTPEGAVSIRGMAQGPSNEAASLEAPYQDALIGALKQSKLLAGLHSRPYVVLDLPWLSEHIPRAKVLLLQPQPQQPGVVIALAVRMDLALPIFSHFASYSEAGNLRAYLVDDKGLVLGHSQSGYVGTRFDQLQLFKNALAPAAMGERLSGSGEFVANDQLPVVLAYKRLADSPLVIAVERLKSSTGLRASFEDLPIENLLKLAGEFAILGLALLLANATLLRLAASGNQNAQIPDTETQQSVPPPFSPNPGDAGVWVDPIQSLDPTPGAPALFNAPTDYFYIREQEHSGKDPQWVKSAGDGGTSSESQAEGMTLVQKAAQLYSSPAFYFKYLPRTGVALLDSWARAKSDDVVDSGEGGAGDLAFPLSHVDLGKILEPASGGQASVTALEGWVKLSAHAPLQRLFASHKGTLESWAFMENEKLKGILVILRGSDSQATQAGSGSGIAAKQNNRSSTPRA